jgi:hypothetical protein
MEILHMRKVCGFTTKQEFIHSKHYGLWCGFKEGFACRFLGTVISIVDFKLGIHVCKKVSGYHKQA